MIEDVSRNRDVFLDQYYRSESTELSYYEELSTSSLLIEDITNELNGTGLSEVLNKFYEAAQSMSLNPTDMVTKTDFVERAQDVADYLNSTANQLNDYRTSLVGDVNDPNSIKTSKVNLYCEDLNDKLNKIAKINENIAMMASGDSAPNSLLDERDKLLDQISEYIPIEVTKTSGALINIKLNNVSLVEGADVKGSFTVESNTVSDPALIKIVDENGLEKVADAKSLINSGKIGAILEMGGSELNKLTINNVLSGLDDIAREFAAEVNRVQTYSDPGDAAATPPVLPSGSACLDTSTNPVTLKRATENIFLDDTDTTANITALNIHVNQNIIDSPAEVATALVDMDDSADPADPTTWVPLDNSEVGNNKIALQMAQIRDTTITGLNNSTVEAFLTSMTGDMGVKAEGIQNSLETQNAVVDQISLKRESSYGVNLDEELVDLTKFQRAYEASARMFNVMNDIMQKIISLGA